MCSLFFFFNDTATTEIYTLSLHDALPILHVEHGRRTGRRERRAARQTLEQHHAERVKIRAAVHIGDSLRLRSEEHTSELQSQSNLVCRLLLEKKKTTCPSPLPAAFCTYHT